MDFEEDEYEVEASTLFRQEAEGLSGVTDLDDTLSRFGFSRDDRIERRELVMMYNKVKQAMETDINRLAHSSAYDEAKNMRARLNSLRGEFDSLQTTGVRKKKEDQTKFFDKAADEIAQSLKVSHSQQVEELRAYCNHQREEQLYYQALARENLELELSRIPRPRMKYSKRMIELFKAETGLINLQQYEDARKVRNMIEKIRPGEEKTFYVKFDAMIQSKREALVQQQAADNVKLEEKLSRIQWDDIRRREKEENISQQRFKNHIKDMTHAQLLESRPRPEMSIKPSALWQKRTGYQETAAAMRGQQLMSVARGQKQGDQVFADPIVTRHNFAQIPPDTVTLS